MSLFFIDANEDDIADVVTVDQGIVVTPVVADGKRGLLGAIGRALLFPDHFFDDNFDSFFDCLGEARGTVVLANAAPWWRAEPRIMGQLCQCFLDVDEHVRLVVAA
jgi:hypothetical protein